MRVVHGDSLLVLKSLGEGSVDAVVTDPPYGLVEPRSGAVGVKPRTEEQKANRKRGFMGMAWDAEVPGAPLWSEVLRVLKPSGYMVCMGGSRTYHRLACAVEDAGFQVRDCIMWLYGQGFPKGKTLLKPAYEPILLCRKPGGKVADLNIEECRVGADGGTRRSRWPANICHDGSEEVSSKIGRSSRYFYCAKPSNEEREGNPHPTVKPLALMRWLVRLVSLPGYTVLDPFAGSGSTLVACHQEKRGATGIEINGEYVDILCTRMRKHRVPFDLVRHKSSVKDLAARVESLRKEHRC